MSALELDYTEIALSAGCSHHVVHDVLRAIKAQGFSVRSEEIPPDLAMELRFFRLIVYIDSDGHEQIDWRWTGEPVTGMGALGYLEAAKLGMFHTQLHDGES